MATTSTHTQAPGGPPPFPPFMKDTFASQLIGLAIAFGLLYLLMAKVGLPRVGEILQARRARIDEDFAEARRFREESEAALAAYEKALADANNRAQTIASETRERLLGESEVIRKGLEAKLNLELAEAEKTIAATKSAAMANVRDVAVEAAQAIVERLIGAVPSGEAVTQAVDRALRR
jgi:F-type H+-transporting ATPase subunit b